MSKRKIMVVDDKPLVATQGIEGIQKARETRPDLIILDIMMPEQGGIQMYREIKTDDALKHIPVVICSGIAKKTYFYSQNLLDSHNGKSVPEPDAYILSVLKNYWGRKNRVWDRGVTLTWKQ